MAYNVHNAALRVRGIMLESWHWTDNFCAISFIIWYFSSRIIWNLNRLNSTGKLYVVNYK